MPRDADALLPADGHPRSPPPLASSEKERLGRFQAAQARKHALIEVCEGEAKRHIVHSRFELAIPAAMYALRFGTSIYGEGNVELVPAFLLLAEANLGLLNFAQQLRCSFVLLRAPLLRSCDFGTKLVRCLLLLLRAALCRFPPCGERSPADYRSLSSSL